MKEEVGGSGKSNERERVIPKQRGEIDRTIPAFKHPDMFERSVRLSNKRMLRARTTG